MAVLNGLFDAPGVHVPVADAIQAAGEQDRVVSSARGLDGPVASPRRALVPTGRTVTQGP